MVYRADQDCTRPIVLEVAWLMVVAEDLAALGKTQDLREATAHLCPLDRGAEALRCSGLIECLLLAKPLVFVGDRRT